VILSGKFIAKRLSFSYLNNTTMAINLKNIEVEKICNFVADNTDSWQVPTAKGEIYTSAAG
jgi:hypothetical protein